MIMFWNVIWAIGVCSVCCELCKVIPIERLYDIPQLFHSLDSEANLREIIRRHSQFEVGLGFFFEMVAFRRWNVGSAKRVENNKEGDD